MDISIDKKIYQYTNVLIYQCQCINPSGASVVVVGRG